MKYFTPKNFMKFYITNRSTNGCPQGRVDSAFYPLWNGQVSISPRADNNKMTMMVRH